MRASSRSWQSRPFVISSSSILSQFASYHNLCDVADLQFIKFLKVAHLKSAWKGLVDGEVLLLSYIILNNEINVLIPGIHTDRSTHLSPSSYESPRCRERSSYGYSKINKTEADSTSSFPELTRLENVMCGRSVGVHAVFASSPSQLPISGICWSSLRISAYLFYGSEDLRRIVMRISTCLEGMTCISLVV